MKIVFEYRFFQRSQESLKGNAQFFQLVPLNFDSKHGSDPFKSTPRMKYSGKHSSPNGPVKLCVNHNLRKKYSIVMSLIYILFQMVRLFCKVLLKS